MFKNNSSHRSIAVLAVLLLIPVIYSGCSEGSVVDTGTGKTAYVYNLPNPLPTPVDARYGDLTVPIMEGGSARMSDLMGGKVVLVNFWATWCGPCRREIPDLIALQREFKDQGFEVIGLTVEDPQMDRQKVEAFIKQYSINYRIGFSSKDLFMLFNGADPRAPIPQTFIFDRNGKLIDRAKGLRRDFRDWVAGAVNQAIKET